MIFDAHERDRLRHGLALLVDEAPVAPEFSNLTAAKLRDSRRRRAPLIVFAASAVAVVVAFGGFALLRVGGPSSLDVSTETPPSTPNTPAPSPTTTSTAPSSTTSPVPASGELPHVVVGAPGWEIEYVDDARGDAADGSGEFHSATVQFTDGMNEAELRFWRVAYSPTSTP